MAGLPFSLADDAKSCTMLLLAKCQYEYQPLSQHNKVSEEFLDMIYAVYFMKLSREYAMFYGVSLAMDQH